MLQPEMPHLTIEYSPNLVRDVDIAALCDRLRQAAVAQDVFPAAGVRVRAIAADYVSIADGNPAHGYIDVVIRLRGGRSQDAKEAATAALFEVVEQFVAPVMAKRPLALSMEMRDIDPSLSPKSGSIRDHLGRDF